MVHLAGAATVLGAEELLTAEGDELGAPDVLVDPALVGTADVEVPDCTGGTATLGGGCVDNIEALGKGCVAPVEVEPDDEQAPHIMRAAVVTMAAVLQREAVDRTATMDNRMPSTLANYAMLRSACGSTRQQRQPLHMSGTSQGRELLSRASLGYLT